MSRENLVAMAILLSLLGSSAALAAAPATQPAAWPFDAAEAARRQSQAASASGIASDASIDLGGNVAMKFALIPPGHFIMGSPEPEKERDDNIEQAHSVTLTRAYFIGVTPVTRGQFAAFVKETDHKTDVERSVGISVGSGGANVSWRNPGVEQADDHPVVMVSWNDAAAFAAWLSKRASRTARLPTEAEWEYACRAGANTPYNVGKTIAVDQANYDGTTRYRGGKTGINRGKTTPVTTFPPNAWGLYDMQGNVWQWCNDYLAPFPESPAVDPTGPQAGLARVFRGGSWYDEARDCRCACRGSLAAPDHTFDIGFRVVLEIPK